MRSLIAGATPTRQTSITPMSNLQKLTALPAWFGKLPAEGEFFGRRFATDLDPGIEDWVRDGMRHLAVAEPEDWKERFLVAPLWHFAMTANLWSKSALLGCIAPSADKFGRTFPLIVVQPFPEADFEGLLPPYCQWFDKLDQLVRRCVGEALAPDDFDQSLLALSDSTRIGTLDSASAILNELGIGDAGTGQGKRFPWPELKTRFPQRKRQCYWWAETAPARPTRQVIHAGLPDAALFHILFGGT